MLKVAGKEVLFTTSFTLGKGEEAVLTPNETPGIRFEINTTVSAAPTTEDFKIDAKGDYAKMTIPFISENSLSSGFGLGNVGPGTLTGRIIGQGVGDFMVVHMDVYLERTPNYGAR